MVLEVLEGEEAIVMTAVGEVVFELRVVSVEILLTGES